MVAVTELWSSGMKGCRRRRSTGYFNSRKAWIVGVMMPRVGALTRGGIVLDHGSRGWRGGLPIHSGQLRWRSADARRSGATHTASQSACSNPRASWREPMGSMRIPLFATTSTRSTTVKAVAVEHWYGQRATIENVFRDSKQRPARVIYPVDTRKLTQHGCAATPETRKINNSNHEDQLNALLANSGQWDAVVTGGRPQPGRTPLREQLSMVGRPLFGTARGTPACA